VEDRIQSNIIHISSGYCSSNM